MDKKISDADRQKLEQKSEQRMKGEADNLRERAIAGEEFNKLQEETYQVARVRNVAFNTSIEIRRASLPPDQISVMDLEPGRVSSVLPDPSGYVIYKIKSKGLIPLDQAREEIRSAIRSQRMQNEMRGIQDSVTPIFDESYFARNRSLQDMTGTAEPARTASSRQSNTPD